MVYNLRILAHKLYICGHMEEEIAQILGLGFCWEIIHTATFWGWRCGLTLQLAD